VTPLIVFHPVSRHRRSSLSPLSQRRNTPLIIDRARAAAAHFNSFALPPTLVPRGDALSATRHAHGSHAHASFPRLCSSLRAVLFFPTCVLLFGATHTCVRSTACQPEHAVANAIRCSICFPQTHKLSKERCTPRVPPRPEQLAADAFAACWIVGITSTTTDVG
jgi:hypothetical protein